MKICLVTGSGGLVGSACCRRFAQVGYQLVGIDNDCRKDFFGPEGSTAGNTKILQEELGEKYLHFDLDIREAKQLDRLFNTFGQEISAIIHTAAQPSHDWSAQQPVVDFTINAQATLTLLELTRKYSPQAAFIFLSTNKVYGDHPNRLPLQEQPTRWEINPKHPFSQGIDESMPLDSCVHSPFGASKLAADILVQEYGRYYGLKTTCLRCGCLTGSSHAGTELHGFLAYLLKCALQGRTYTIYGYQGKQVRDNLHSTDLAEAIYCCVQRPGSGAVYNLGGGREVNCSLQEAIALCKELSGCQLKTRYHPLPRKGDHIWWITNYARFQQDYPQWRSRYGLRQIMEDILKRVSTYS